MATTTAPIRTTRTFNIADEVFHPAAEKATRLGEDLTPVVEAALREYSKQADSPRRSG
jgi:hypothetical protein